MIFQDPSESLLLMTVTAPMLRFYFFHFPDQAHILSTGDIGMIFIARDQSVLTQFFQETSVPDREYVDVPVRYVCSLFDVELIPVMVIRLVRYIKKCYDIYCRGSGGKPALPWFCPGRSNRFFLFQS